MASKVIKECKDLWDLLDLLDLQDLLEKMVAKEAGAKMDKLGHLECLEDQES
jgi:hypothetical protein